SSLANFETDYGPEFTLRYNEYRGAQIFGSAAPGYSSQQATAALEDVFHQTMPHEMGFDYMGMSYQEQKARQGVPAWAIFALSLLFVFLILAALYESWTLPFSVLLSTPVAVFGALAALWLRRFVIGLYCRVRAAMDSVRRRLSRATDYRNDRDRRHAGGDVYRQVLCSGDLLRR